MGGTEGGASAVASSMPTQGIPVPDMSGAASMGADSVMSGSQMDDILKGGSFRPELGGSGVTPFTKPDEVPWKEIGSAFGSAGKSFGSAMSGSQQQAAQFKPQQSSQFGPVTNSLDTRNLFKYIHKPYYS